MSRLRLKRKVNMADRLLTDKAGAPRLRLTPRWPLPFNGLQALWERSRSQARQPSLSSLHQLLPAQPAVRLELMLLRVRSVRLLTMRCESSRPCLQLLASVSAVVRRLQLHRHRHRSCSPRLGGWQQLRVLLAPC